MTLGALGCLGVFFCVLWRVNVLHCMFFMAHIKKKEELQNSFLFIDFKAKLFVLSISNFCFTMATLFIFSSKLNIIYVFEQNL